MQHIISNVSILYPRLNQPYRFDNGERRSVSCNWDADGAAYDTSFIMDKEEALNLSRVCKEAYKNAASMGKGKWPAAPQRLPAKRSDATELEAAGDIILDDADATAVCERSGATDSLEAAGDIDDVDDADATAV